MSNQNHPLSIAVLAAFAAPLVVVAAPASAQTATASGEVRRVDAAQGKITIKHEAIADLGLPAMTLVYQIAPELLAGVNPGDKVTFTASRVNDGYVITKISK